MSAAFCCHSGEATENKGNCKSWCRARLHARNAKVKDATYADFSMPIMVSVVSATVSASLFRIAAAPLITTRTARTANQINLAVTFVVATNCRGAFIVSDGLRPLIADEMGVCQQIMRPDMTLKAAEWPTSEDVKEYQIDALKDELNGALRVLTCVLMGAKTANDAAWWLSANHARFIIDHPNLDAEKAITALAEAAGTPPKGDSWAAWYARVRNIKPSDILRKQQR